MVDALIQSNPRQYVPLNGKNSSIGIRDSLRPQLESCTTHFLSSHNALQVINTPACDSHYRTLASIELPSFLTSSWLSCIDQMEAATDRAFITCTQERVGLIDWLKVFMGRSRQNAYEYTLQARRQRASKLAHERGGIIKTASYVHVLQRPRDYRTLATPRIKHTAENLAAFATGKVRAK